MYILQEFSEIDDYPSLKAVSESTEKLREEAGSGVVWEFYRNNGGHWSGRVGDLFVYSITPIKYIEGKDDLREQIKDLMQYITELKDKIAFAIDTLDVDEEEFNGRYEGEWK